MNREIKFRVWDGLTMHYLLKGVGKNLAFFSEGIPWGLYDTATEARLVTGDPDAILNKPGVLMQYSGLKDKNGKEIWEGDVLEKWELDYDSEEYQKWAESGFEGEEPKKTIRIIDECSLDHIRFWLKNESFGYEGEDLQSPNDWEIIGNIYQNPELINDQTTTNNQKQQ